MNAFNKCGDHESSELDRRFHKVPSNYSFSSKGHPLSWSLWWCHMFIVDTLLGSALAHHRLYLFVEELSTGD
jgi:hypothetical protein